jgi:hypothetical protein
MRRDPVRFVTANYYQLQGLRLVPLGVFLLILAASAAGWFQWLPHERRWLAAAFGLTLLGSVAGTGYYRRRYGSVAQFGRAGRNLLITLSVLIFVGLAQLDQRLVGTVSLAPLWIAVALLATVWADGWIRAHFLIGAAMWIAVGVVFSVPAAAESRLVAYYVAGGFTLLVCGMGDHLLISRTLNETGITFDAANPTI